MTPVSHLRAHTASLHDMVDGAFSGYDLTEQSGYRVFLLAHALALPAAEAAFASRPDLPPWRERASLLAADLADLHNAMPLPLPFALPPVPAAAWGALYVTEGSRLGGAMLARGIPSSLPSRYLGARHGSGEWRALLAATDAEGEVQGDDWVKDALAGAATCFALYLSAARSQPCSI